MAFRFQRKESAAEGVRRVVREQTGLAVSLLADRAGDMAENIHEARRCIKRLRATLKLVRPRMNEDASDVANIELRDASRKLSWARDTAVSLSTFEHLSPRLSGPAVPRIRAMLNEACRKARRRALSVNRLAAIAGCVRATGHRIVLADLAENGWPLIATGIADSYSKARHTARRLGDDTDPATVHEWRKVTKALQFQLELVRRALPKARRKTLRHLEKLGVILGDHHDLDTLRTTLAAQPSTAGFRTLDDLITRQLARRIRSARRIAKQAFAERPKAFIAGIRLGWNKWRG
jgi:CHAD domain-containing protein